MAPKNKRKKSKVKRISLKSTFQRKKKTKETDWIGPGLKNIFKVFVILCVICGIVIGLIFLERYIKETAPPPEGTFDLELVGVPIWVNEQLKQKVLEAARANSKDLRPDKDMAPLVQRNIEELISWLDEVKVWATHNCLHIEGQWRKPIAIVKSNKLKFYVDTEQVVLDFVDIQNLPIVEIKGLSSVTKMPPPGESWQQDDLAAAITILSRFDQRDKTLTLEKPLLYELNSIDVSNFDGRKNSRNPHIVLYAKDNTEIIWGAEMGKWHQYLESTDEQKLAKLYGYYKEFGTLSGGVKYINLRDPQDNIPLPIDKY